MMADRFLKVSCIRACIVRVGEVRNLLSRATIDVWTTFVLYERPIGSLQIRRSNPALPPIADIRGEQDAQLHHTCAYGRLWDRAVIVER